MANWKKISLLLFLLLLGHVQNTPALAADSKALAAFLADVRSQSSQVRSFSCLFVQERHLALFARPVIFHGALFIIRPDHLRWEFTDPVPSVLIFNGNKGIRCNDDAPPVHFDLKSDPIMRMVAYQLWTWLDGDYEKLETMYDLKLHNKYCLVIIPKEQGVVNVIATITITFDEKTMQPEMVEIVEPGGDLTRIRFHDYKLNVSFSEAVFTRCGNRE